MNKTAQTELHRLFLVERLPDPLTPASSHLQIFDNYIAGTRLRLRRIRDPYSQLWTRLLQQRFPIHQEIGGETKLVEMHLDDHEYAVLERFEGREIRKNRYFHEYDRIMFTFDIYLGGLWGLNTARVDFTDLVKMSEFVPPPFAIIEVTDFNFFDGKTLVDKTFGDVQSEVDRLGNNGI
jgi:CYTH domain-containing protein